MNHTFLNRLIFFCITFLIPYIVAFLFLMSMPNEVVTINHFYFILILGIVVAGISTVSQILRKNI